MNTIQLIGRLGSDITIRTTNSGLSVTSFSLALPGKKNGEDITTWIKCTAFGELADNLADAASKGDRLIVSGRLQANSWTDKEGNERSSNDLILEDAGLALRWSRNRAQNWSDSLGGEVPAAGGAEPF